MTFPRLADSRRLLCVRALRPLPRPSQRRPPPLRWRRGKGSRACSRRSRWPRLGRCARPRVVHWLGALTPPIPKRAARPAAAGDFERDANALRPLPPRPRPAPPRQAEAESAVARLEEEAQLKGEALKAAADRLRALENESADERSAREAAEGHADRVTAELADLQARPRTWRGPIPKTRGRGLAGWRAGARVRSRAEPEGGEGETVNPAWPLAGAGEAQGALEKGEAGHRRGGQGGGALRLCSRSRAAGNGAQGL